MAYATKLWGGQGKTKRQVALEVGFTPSTANSAVKIEGTKGYQLAVAKLAKESNNLAVAVMAEFKARGFRDFSNKDLVGALNAVGNAWSKFNPENKIKKDEREGGNRLRTVIMQRVENQVITPEYPVTPYRSPRTFNPIKEDQIGAEENAWEDTQEEDRRVVIDPFPDVE